jgi:Protein of unknown function (DUF3499)
MEERRTAGNTNRQCARFGCSAIAIATFTFDSETRTVWLDTPLDGNARAGELCARHAQSLTPPRGWQLEDRRPGRAARTERIERAESTEGAEQLVRTDNADARHAPRVVRGPAPQLAAGPVRVELEDELRGLLDAHSPLLARAFRSSGPV